MTILLDYRFDSASVTSAVGGHVMSLPGAQLVPGPGETPFGPCPQALRFGGTVAGTVPLAGLALPAQRWAVRLMFRVNTPVVMRENLVESDRFPFAIFLDRTSVAGQPFTIRASVNSAAYGWTHVDSRFGPRAPATGEWILLDLLFDTDTLVMLIDGRVADIQCLPRPALVAMGGSQLFVGSWVDRARHRFAGDIAALQVHADIPEALLPILADVRRRPSWFISRKRLELHGVLNIGAEAGATSWDPAARAYVQQHAAGLIMYDDAAGVAFEMHGAIWQAYNALPVASRQQLGPLVTDEMNAQRAGARKSLFAGGGIYWSARTGAHAVLDRIYLAYEDLREARGFGLPTAAERAIPGGVEQAFEGARFYHRRGQATAFEVHGEILRRFLETGGTGAWGFPVSHEQDVLANTRGGSPRPIGRMSEFEHATWYWSAATGAHEVHGDIRRKYLECGGPAGEFGFPTTSESDIPDNAGPGKINLFQKGAICWYGSFASIVLVRPFKVFVGRLSTREDEGFGMGQNDLYCYLRVSDGSQTYDQRHPSSGDWGGNNSRDINLTIPQTFQPTSIGYRVSFRLRAMDSDPGNDDHLGTVERTLSAANAWGLRNNNGIFNDSNNKVLSLTWSVKPQVDIASLSEEQKWWGKDNDKTDDISYPRYARAFSDVDSDPEDWDLTDWLEKAFYELVVKDLADGGNCFGMAVEGIYARKNRSVFGMPLNRFTQWNQLESEFNIKHCYQVGAQAIWWFLGQFVSGNTGDPVDVFNNSHAAFLRGEHPVICIAQNRDFSGKPHCILPVRWRKNGSSWEIDILDPNVPNAVRQLTVNAATNRFRYQGSDAVYEGGEWSGGRFHYMPFGVLCSRPRTPIWDAIMLLLSGAVIIFASDTTTEAITDADGNSLDAFSPAAQNRLKAGKSNQGYFMPYRGFAGEAVKAQMLFRTTPRRRLGSLFDPGVIAHQPVSALLGTRDAAVAGLRDALSGVSDQTRSMLADRSIGSLLSDRQLRARLDPGLVQRLEGMAAANTDGAFNHRLAARRAGRLDWLVKTGRNAVRMEGALKSAEKIDIAVRDLDSSRQRIGLTPGADKTVTFTQDIALGNGRDRMRLLLRDVPVARGRPIDVHLQPGLGGAEIAGLPDGAPALRVELEGRIGGTAIARRFQVPVDKAVRLDVAPALNQGALSAGKIDGLFQPVRQVRSIPTG